MKNTNAAYMAGNGKIAAAYCNGDIIQLFGPPYSSPSLLQSNWRQQSQRSLPRRVPGSAIWEIELLSEVEIQATVTDFALPHHNCIVRHVHSKAPVCMRLFPTEEDGRQFDYALKETENSVTTILLKSKNGNPVYNDYPLPFPQFFQILVRGDAIVDEVEPYCYDICIDGAADILVIGGPSYPECCCTAQAVTDLSYADMRIQTEQYWHTVLGQMSVLHDIPKEIPRYDELVWDIETTAVCILVQQSAEGGVMAGIPYHLGYVRDQYGVCMGMLKLGLYAQARQMLQFYIDVFHRSGKVLNAQGMGVPELFHFAENDSTEIPGYLLLQFFRYAEVTGDEKFLTDQLDFLLWLYHRQLPELAANMLPFNGDETYIAGGLLPRDIINDGSAEATLLFIASGKELLSFLKKNKATKLGMLSHMRHVLEETEAAYADNFVRNGVYTLNNPERCRDCILPEFRYGVCMNLGKGDCDFFGWTQLCPGEVYLCPKCRHRKDYPKKKTEYYHLPSALLMPTYLHAILIDENSIANYLQSLSAMLEKQGFVYSNEALKKNVGYDYGLMLYNFVAHKIGNAEKVYHKLLDLADETGTWSEYYVQDEASGTRFRPWESAINMDALLTYALQYRP